MEPKFQTSFIPKKPLDSSPKDFLYKPSSGGIFSSIAIFIFILALLLSVGVFFYKQVLIRQIDSANKEITLAREAFQESTIKQILNYDNQLKSAKRILDNHVLVYSLLDELSVLTLKNISLKNFKYKNVDNKVTIESDVLSKSYNALAQESNIFSNSKYMINPIFSDFELTKEGYISGKFNSLVDNSLISYKRIMNSSNQ